VQYAEVEEFVVKTDDTLLLDEELTFPGKDAYSVGAKRSYG
jgi:hypothetical protein